MNRLLLVVVIIFCSKSSVLNPITNEGRRSGQFFADFQLVFALGELLTARPGKAPAEDREKGTHADAGHTAFSRDDPLGRLSEFVRINLAGVWLEDATLTEKVDGILSAPVHLRSARRR